jgi:ribosome-binding protein aMBF1 (putative translation factor)
MSYARQLGYAVRRVIEQDEATRANLMSELQMTEDELDRLCKGRLMLTFEEQEQVEQLLNMSYDQIMDQSKTQAYQSVVHCMTPFSDPENLDIIMDFIDAYIDAKEILQEKVLPS